MLLQKGNIFLSKIVSKAKGVCDRVIYAILTVLNNQTSSDPVFERIIMQEFVLYYAGYKQHGQNNGRGGVMNSYLKCQHGDALWSFSYISIKKYHIKLRCKYYFRNLIH